MSGCYPCYISVSLRQIHIEQDTKIIHGGYPAVFQSVGGFIVLNMCVPSSTESLHSAERNDPQHEPFSMCKSDVLRCGMQVYAMAQRERKKTLSDAASLKLLQWCMSFRKSKPKCLPLNCSSCCLPTLSNLKGCSGWVSHPAMTAAYLISLHPGGFTLQVSFLTAHTSLIETLVFTFSVYYKSPKAIYYPLTIFHIVDQTKQPCLELQSLKNTNS